jgi:hypothetical protein
MTKKYDHIIGNPPYQDYKNSNLYVDFIEKSVDNLRMGGSFAMICPNRFMLPHHKANTLLRKHFTVTKLYVDVNRYFPSIGTSIGVIIAKRSNGQEGPVPVELKDGTTIQHDLSEPFPTKMPTLEGLALWQEIKSQEHYTVLTKRPTHDKYVWISRQWKSSKGVIYFDAVEQGDGDGKYIEVANPSKLATKLRATPRAAELHNLYGDQMNIWPFLWGYITND